MKLSKYQKKATRTFESLGNLKLDLSHMTLGMITESNEIIEALMNENLQQAQEEIGDLLWYIANYCTIREFDLEELIDNDAVIEDWILDNGREACPIKIAQLADIVKKHIAYDKELNKDQEKEYLTVLLHGILLFIHEIDENTIEHILKNNIKKLKVRFPDKFSKEKALDRNLEKEKLTLV